MLMLPKAKFLNSFFMAFAFFFLSFPLACAFSEAFCFIFVTPPFWDCLLATFTTATTLPPITFHTLPLLPPSHALFHGACGMGTWFLLILMRSNPPYFKSIKTTSQQISEFSYKKTLPFSHKINQQKQKHPLSQPWCNHPHPHHQAYHPSKPQLF